MRLKNQDLQIQEEIELLLQELKMSWSQASLGKLRGNNFTHPTLINVNYQSFKPKVTWSLTQPVITSSKLTTKMLEQSLKYVQSWQ